MRPKTVNLNLLREMIYLIDSYRINRYVDIGKIDKAVERGLFTKRIEEIWKNARKVLLKMASFPNTVPGIVKWVKMRIVFDFVATISLLAAMIIVLAKYFTRFALSIIYDYAMIFGLILTTVTWALARVSNIKVASALNKFFEENPRKFEGERNYLRETVQDLIDEYTRQVRIMKVDPEKHPLMLYNIDYRGIRIVKPPAKTGKYYVVIVES